MLLQNECGHKPKPVLAIKVAMQVGKIIANEDTLSEGRLAVTEKRALGKFYTRGNPFYMDPFKEWAKDAGLPDKCLLEPFAGANHIVNTLQKMGLCNSFKAYDAVPADKAVIQRDTLACFPQSFDVCVTNPPWLARNSATRRGLPFPANRYDNLYKHCLKLCLDNCTHVAALIPASFLQSKLFRDRLKTFILLHKTIFSDTENPVCLSLFGPPVASSPSPVNIYHDDKHIGTLEALEAKRPKNSNRKKIRFNDPDGELGFISFDNTKGPSIRFCDAKTVANYQIKVSSRFVTRIGGDFVNLPKLLTELNTAIHKFRTETQDVFLTPFKGIRADGVYRRRMGFALARMLINAA